MGLFNKKKEKYHTLDRGLLAEAITIYSDKIDLRPTNKMQWIYEVIHLNDILEIRIPYIHHHLGAYAHYYSMNVETYVEGIQMAKYSFELDMSFSIEKYRKWTCEEKDIMHYMPNQFIDLMNEWSNKVVSEFTIKQKKIEHEKREFMKSIYDEEESVLDKYRQ